MPLKTGTDILQGWAFSGDKMALGVLICETPSADSLCSEGVFSFWTPRQEPENKQVMVKFWLTLLEGMISRQLYICHMKEAVGTSWEQKAYTGPWNHVQHMKPGSNWGSRCSLHVQDTRIGCDPRWKALLSQWVYQDYILWWPVTLWRSILFIHATENLAATCSWSSTNSKAYMHVWGHKQFCHQVTEGKQCEDHMRFTQVVGDES